jgi:hypothetical protein
MRPTEEGLSVQPPVTDLASVITDVSKSLQRLLASGLQRSAVITLLVSDTGISKRQITKVLGRTG